MRRPSLNRLLAFAFVLGCAHAKPAPAVSAPPRPADEVAVDRVLRAEAAPAVESWLRLGMGATALLKRAALDARRPDAERIRAIHGLSLVLEPSASWALADLLSDLRQGTPIRIEAVRSLALRDGRAAGPILARGLADPVPEVRIAVAQAMGSLGGSPIRQSLEEQLDKESDAGVREVLLQSLSRAQP